MNTVITFQSDWKLMLCAEGRSHSVHVLAREKYSRWGIIMSIITERRSFIVFPRTRFNSAVWNFVWFGQQTRVLTESFFILATRARTWDGTSLFNTHTHTKSPDNAIIYLYISLLKTNNEMKNCLASQPVSGRTHSLFAPATAWLRKAWGVCCFPLPTE